MNIESKNTEPNFTELESCFNTLNDIGITLKNTIKFQDDIFEKFSKIINNFEMEYKGKKVTPEKQHEEFKREFMKSMNDNPEIDKGKKHSMIFLQLLIINLYKLIEIHPTLIKNLKKMDEEKLEKSLQDFWQPIQKQEKRIRDWRNNIVAHAKDSAKKMTTFSKIDENFQSFPKEIHLLATCAILYISGISRNVPEFSNAIAALQRQMKYPKNAYLVSEWYEIQNEIGTLIENVKKTLKKNGYNNKIDFISGTKYPRK